MNERRDVLDRIRLQVPPPGFAELVDRRDRRARRARTSAMVVALVVAGLVIGGVFLTLGGLRDDGASGVGAPRDAAIAHNGRIAFTVKEPDGWHVATVNPDGTDRAILTRSERDYNPSWSPDGTTIAYDTNLHGGIWLMNADGSDQHELTTGNDLFPNWSPDGTRIAFTRYATDMQADRPASNTGTHLWIVNADGTGEHQVTEGGSVELSGSWSPDSDMVTFFRVGSNGGEASIWVINADGSGARRVTTLPDDFTGNPSWSPNGAQIAYSRNTFVEGTWEPRIWVVNVDGTGDHMLLDMSGTDPTWSPDGTQIAYTNGDIWVVDADGANTKQVTSDPRNEILPSWGVDRSS